MLTSRRSIQFLLFLSLLSFPLFTATGAADDLQRIPEEDGAVSKLHPSLTRLLSESPEAVKAWVFFADKGVDSPQKYAAAIEQVASTYNRRAIQRRQIRSTRSRNDAPIFNEHDLPVVQAYVDAVQATGVEIRVTSRWINAVSAVGTKAQFDEVARLPFIRKLQPVARSAGIRPLGPEQPLAPAPPGPSGDRAERVDYGSSYNQLAQMNLVALHNAGYTGAGVIVGMLDSGFKTTHEAYNNPVKPLTVIAAYDFINDDPNVGPEAGDPSDQHDHGTKTLSCLAAYKPGSLVGGAFDASFILAKTEDTSDEYPAEEDNYVAGLEFIESNGGDMESSSLGYIDWYTQDDLDGQTAVTTIAVNISTSLGVHHVNSAGNEYHDSNPNTSSIIAPSDAFQAIAAGAVDSFGDIVYFSSDGPSADGRVKPELLALGSGAAVVSSSSDTGYTTASGTSFSAPLIAASVACLVQAKPYWTVDQMRQHLFETATDFVANGTYDPLYVRGYGIIDAYAAFDTCSDAGVVTLDRSKYTCESTAAILVNDCGLNTDDGAVEFVTVDVDSDSETGIEQLTLTETDPGSAEFLGTIALSLTDAGGVLLVAEGDTVTVTYVDADDGAGGVNVVVTAEAVVDCTPPVISNVQTTNVEPRSAVVTFSTDEPATGTVHYGMSCGALLWSASGAGYTTAPAINVTGLQDDTTYFYTVGAADEAGNAAGDDNGGNCYSFTTPEVPDYFTEQFSGSFDLDGLTVTFTPNGSNDYYAGCVEEIIALPTDPVGGTALNFSPTQDDGYATLTLSGGETVSLYGVNYGTFYPGTNGYITFGSGDTTYSEDLSEHFGMPRVSALFDDLNPSAGGTVTWKQLSDRAVVTWDDVPKYYDEGANTFQIELFFDGHITVSYLGITNSEGIAGLSEGDGPDPDFYESDLSAMGPCVPPGDCDADGNIDEDDYAVFVDCFSGAGGGLAPGCACVDIDGDGDVDCKDLNLFGQLWTAGGDPPTFGPCAEPTAWAEGGRYLAITPISGSDPVALLVVGDPADPAVSCINRYVQADGTLGDAPVFKPPTGPDGWNTVRVFGEQIAPSSLYQVYGDYGTPGSPSLSPGETVTTALWGDVEFNGVVNFTDVQWILLRFEGTAYLCAFEEANISPCGLDDAVNFTDIQASILSFEGASYFGGMCPRLCP